ncbi:hypothetical protein [Nostoc sp. UHCC 0302]|uniref:hypothetical protein n=1 Tax=Nostoc sp. UHCC 0302 TaxID=3134896 RepID=UPI00311CAFBC
MISQIIPIQKMFATDKALRMKLKPVKEAAILGASSAVEQPYTSFRFGINTFTTSLTGSVRMNYAIG